MDFLKVVSSRLYELRLEADQTLAEVAEGSGTTINNISRYEKGQRMPAFDILTGIANYYNVSLDYLSGRTNARNTLDDLPPNYAKLSDDEQKLLKRFRTMDEDGREILLGKALDLVKFGSCTGDSAEQAAL